MTMRRMMPWYRIGVFLVGLLGLLGAMAVGLTGCAKRKDDSGGSGRPRVALIMKSLANEFFTTMAEGARRHRGEHADEYDLIVNGIKDERDLARQSALVEEMMASRVDAIVIAPADSKALAPVLKRAQQAGVVVINIDNKLDESVLKDLGIQIPFVGPDNRKGARLVGEYLAKRLPKGAEVAILEGVPTAFNSQERRAGFEEAMQAAGHRVVSVQSGQWETAIANRVAASLLSEHPQLQALLCCNDNMALGALAAVKEAGKLGKVQIVGFDNIEAVREAVLRGEIVATADQHADQLAVFGIEYALQVLRTSSTPQDKETPVDLVTRETLASAKAEGDTKSSEKS